MSDVEDIFAADTATPVSVATGYVVCDFESMSVAIPQADVVAIEHGGELGASLPGESAFGWFSCPHGPWPVYALDGALRLAQQVSTPRSFVVFLKANPWPRGLLVSAVRIVGKPSDLSLQALPQPLRDYSPGITGVARVERSRLLYAFDTGALAALLIDTQVVREVRCA
jgi:hypothetical protein